MNIVSLMTFHRHYWGVPHERDRDKRLIQTCYECGSEREIRVDLRASFRAEDVGPKRDDLKAA